MGLRLEPGDVVQSNGIVRALFEEDPEKGNLTLDQAFKNMVKSCDVPMTQAARMASLNAARVLRLDHRKGVLAVGKDADIVVLDEGLDVEMTIFNGCIVYRK